MSKAYSLLLDTAALLKVDKTQVKEDENCEGKAVMKICDVEVTVSRDKKTCLLLRAKFDYIGISRFSIKSEPFLSVYTEKLVRMIKAVVYKKMYSAPWVAVAVKELLAKKVGKCKVRLENYNTAILTLLPASMTKNAKKLQLRIVELSGNDIGSYYYRVDYMDGPTIGRVIDVADLDKVINDIADIAEGAYDKWVEESKVAPQPKSDYERDMDSLYLSLKSRYRNMKNSSLTFTRTSGTELSISSNSNGDICFVKYDSFVGDISLRTVRRSNYRSRYKHFRLDDPKRFEKVASVVFGFVSKSEE